MLLERKSTEARANDAELLEHRLPCSGWSVRAAKGSGGRTAVEVFAGDGLMDVSVGSPLDPFQVRGARHGIQDGRHWAVVWGRSPAQTARVDVSFHNWRSVQRTSTAPVFGRFWVVEMAGRFRSATVRLDGCWTTVRLVSA
jgi:hypothetical protein